MTTETKTQPLICRTCGGPRGQFQRAGYCSPSCANNMVKRLYPQQASR
jgi:hypothetical protein